MSWRGKLRISFSPARRFPQNGRRDRTCDLCGRPDADDYIDHLASTVEDGLAGLRILFDCANGAASATAPQLFDRFDDLHCDIINADPDGININTNCGSTHLRGWRPW